MQTFLEGKKTWIALTIIVLGWAGWGDLISAGQLSDAIDAGTQLVGVLLAVYGNWASHKKIEKLGRSSFCKSCLELV